MHRPAGYLLCLTVVLGSALGCGTSIHDEAAAGNVDKIIAMLHDLQLVNARNPKGKTPLFYAVTTGRKEVVEILLSYGADVHAADVTGMTPLHVAAWMNRREQASQLLGHGADIEAKDVFGDTPLHSAALRGNLDVLQFLVERGARTDAKNNKGLTPLELARQNRQDKVAAKLEELAAKEPGRE